MFLSNEDYNIRKVCTEREEHERYIEHLKNKATSLESELEETKTELNSTKNKNDMLMKLLKDNGIDIPDDTEH
jgi:chromosome segregation ATPase